jgi:protein-disulfide isomerase
VWVFIGFVESIEADEMTSMAWKAVKIVALAYFVVLALPIMIMAADQSCDGCLGGGLDAPIKIEVFSDFQCPACRALYLDTMKQVLRDYASAGKVCVIYHEFPLAMHQYAREAARFSLAAQKLGRDQWLAVIDVLYTYQPAWTQNGAIQTAIEKALSPSDFQKLQKILLEPSINETIDRDVALGQKKEVQSTPTFFVTALGKEQKITGGLPYSVLKDFFDKIVK